jgi:hypothetical protein
MPPTVFSLEFLAQESGEREPTCARQTCEGLPHDRPFNIDQLNPPRCNLESVPPLFTSITGEKQRLFALLHTITGPLLCLTRIGLVNLHGMPLPLQLSSQVAHLHRLARETYDGSMAID